jgi:tetratricopeptide (TPR) repeat protein
MYSTADPVIYYQKADNYRRMNDHESAERMYLRSLEILPNRFQTVHLMMTFYDETGQEEKAQEIRKMIERRRKRR